MKLKKNSIARAWCLCAGGLLCLLCALPSAAQQKVKLSTMIDRLAQQYGTVISYSPGVIADVEVADRSVQAATLDEALTTLLQGQSVKYGRVDSYYYIYHVKEVPIAIRRDTIPLQVIQAPQDFKVMQVEYPTADDYVKAYRIGSIKRYQNELYLSRWALYTNLLYDATGSVAAGVEFGLAPKWTARLGGSFNFWSDSESYRFKHWLVNPELRYWFCQRFSGWYADLHAHYAKFNVGGLPDFYGHALADSRHQGWLLGAGLGFGYDWVLSNRWNFELGMGVGYAHIEYGKYPCVNCGSRLKSAHKEYVGPTQAAVSLIYMIDYQGSTIKTIYIPLSPAAHERSVRSGSRESLFLGCKPCSWIFLKYFKP